MNDNEIERLRDLCQQVQIETDSEKLVALVNQINEVFKGKEKRLKSPFSPTGPLDPRGNEQ
jgi:hypothetical protein